MSKHIKEYLIKIVDYIFLKYFTVERGRNKRKLIWKTKIFKEITQFYIPKFLFLGFFVIMCWKINDKIKDIRSEKFIHYKTKSSRVEQIEKDNKHIEYFLNIPNQFDPNKTNDAVSVELKDQIK